AHLRHRLRRHRARARRHPDFGRCRAFRPPRRHARRLPHDSIPTRKISLQPKMKIIALEEHYWDKEVASHFDTFGPEMKNQALHERLHDLGALRVKEMDEAGIDVQVLSHGAPATQRLDAATAVPVARGANDRLRKAIEASGGRLEGFAVLPSADP